MSARYSLYGLRIESAIALPCRRLPDSVQATDVLMRECVQEDLDQACRRPVAHSDHDGFWEYRRFEDGAARISWKDHFDFVVSADGGRVLWRRLAGVPDEVLFTYLLNQVLSHCLLLRGVETLHATSVVIDGGAIAILGDSGYGKSTLAAAFLREGYPVLTDDVLVPSFSGSRVLALPSLPRLKLDPEIADAWFAGRPALPMNAFTDKKILPLRAVEHMGEPVPLRAFFVLPSAAGPAAVSIRPAASADALLALVRNTFEPNLFNRHRLEQQFRFAGRLARSVPVRLLSYPRRIDALPAVMRSILAELSREEAVH